MTDKDIETIITTAIHNSESVAVDWTGIRDEASGEIEDLEALLAYIAAMREIVQAVAAMRDNWFVDVETDPDGVPEAYPCPHCGVDLNRFDAQHAPDCPVTKARALLKDG